MTNKEFDQWLRESLSDQTPDANPGDWDSFVKRVEDSETTEDTAFDQQIRGSVSSLGAEYTPDWERMEGMLDAEVLDFDDQVRDSVDKIDIPYNPRTWPLLDARLSKEEQTRRRVIAAKVLEIAAILVALFTFYNLFPALQERMHDAAGEEQYQPIQNNNNIAPIGSPAVTDSDSENEGLLAENSAAAASGRFEAFAQSTPSASGDQGQVVASGLDSDQTSEVREALFVPAIASNGFPPVTSDSEAMAASMMNTVVTGNTIESPAAEIGDHTALNALSPLGLKVLASSAAFESPIVPAPALRKDSKVRFGMMAAADINTLFVPDEFFYSQGRAIRFSAKEIEAGGYTAGASLVFDQPRFLVETGVTYSSKTFRPDRSLFIGTSPDQHELDFENITLDIVSVPLYLHLKIDGKGLWRFYTVGGAALHVIANAQYDLIAENTNPPASAAPLDPAQIQNQREVQRVREHMLDGAKFNSKAYLTASGGFGIEHFLNSRTSIFAQPMYHYQISFFGLIDQNGKHLRSTSLLLGTRISL